jgi:hypothetical protein
MYNKCKGNHKFPFGRGVVLQEWFSSIIILYAFKLYNAIRPAKKYLYKHMERCTILVRSLGADLIYVNDINSSNCFFL